MDKKVHISDVKPIQDWNKKDDENLLNSIWENGLGNWENILKDTKYFPSDFFNEEVKKAVIKCAKKLVEKNRKGCV